MTPQGASLRKGSTGNGRSKAENIAYARIGALGLSRDQQLRAAETAWKGRREAARARVIERDGPQPAEVMERLIDREISRQMEKARAAALTARRKAREAAGRLEAAEAELLDASGLADCGSDGIDA